MRCSFRSSGLALAFALAAVPACIVEAPTPINKKAAPAGATAPRLPPAPPIDVKSGANFGDAFELVSLTLSSGRAVAGESLRASANFKVKGRVEADYHIFVHVEDVDGRSDRLNIDHPPVRGSLPTSRWEVGQVVRDEFEINVPPGMPVRGLNILLGFWDPKTDSRLPLKNPEAVRNDGRDRVLVATVPVLPPQ
jgi:hypothetical protein